MSQIRENSERSWLSFAIATVAFFPLILVHTYFVIVLTYMHLPNWQPGLNSPSSTQFPFLSELPGIALVLSIPAFIIAMIFFLPHLLLSNRTWVGLIGTSQFFMLHTGLAVMAGMMIPESPELRSSDPGGYGQAMGLIVVFYFTAQVINTAIGVFIGWIIGKLITLSPSKLFAVSVLVLALVTSYLGWIAYDPMTLFKA